MTSFPAGADGPHGNCGKELSVPLGRGEHREYFYGGPGGRGDLRSAEWLGRETPPLRGLTSLTRAREWCAHGNLLTESLPQLCPDFKLIRHRCGIESQRIPPFDSFLVFQHSEKKDMSHQENQSCIEACVKCAQECEHCGDACLGEKSVGDMVHCIRLDRDCAQACWMAAAFMSRGSEFMRGACELCAETCDACAEECMKHQNDHCKRCAEACSRCADECRKMAGAAV
jgi:hypothetical protein